MVNSSLSPIGHESSSKQWERCRPHEWEYAGPKRSALHIDEWRIGRRTYAILLNARPNDLNDTRSSIMSDTMNAVFNRTVAPAAGGVFLAAGTGSVIPAASSTTSQRLPWFAPADAELI
jgi:hypothetical protein